MKKTSFIIWLTYITIISIVLIYLGSKFNDLRTYEHLPGPYEENQEIEEKII